MQDIYDELGVKKLIDAAGTYTIVGGSRMSAESLQAMNQAAAHHVLIRELQEAVHREIARLTGNEDAVITAGAIVGVYLCMAACVSRKFGKALKLISKEEIANSEIIMFRAHRNPYDRGLELLGVKIVELGYPNNIDIVSEEALENAITDRTVGMLYLPSTNGGWVPPGALELEKTLAICKRHDIPVVVDAAAQLPPKGNLWHFTQELGASAVCFSGGKDLKGPQTTGVVLGKKDLLHWVNVNNFPNYGIGRMHKVGREELAGIYMAVKQYVEHDENARREAAEEMVRSYVEAFGEGDAFHFERAFPNEAGQPLPRAKLIITKAGLTAESIRELLLNLDRAVFSMVENGYLYVNPYTLTAEEAGYILGIFKTINSKEKEK